MNSRLCAKLGIEFPLFAFSHCRNVVVEVSKAGGFGVLGAAALSTYYVGQAVGLMNKEKSVKTIVYEFMEDYVEAVERLFNTLK